MAIGDDERMVRAEALFQAVVDLPPSQRQTALREECQGDAELRQMVEQLLACDERWSASAAQRLCFWTAPLELGDSDPAPGPRPPFQLADFRAVRVLGEGGMGVVYEAQQDRPQRMVALKVLRSLLPGGESARRFAAEADILGRLSHPGIAQVYAAGTAEAATADGGRMRLPFVAMELVRGEPLRAFAENPRLSVRDRLHLFAQVCDAVHHAHQKGVIHRDLKPANILVDAAGVPKVLDFGVARLCEPETVGAGPRDTLHTSDGQLLGTVAYMSPEQAAGRSGLADTRCDVYSLGVILFELLSGRLPHDVVDKPWPEAVEAIREREPARLGSVDRALRGEIETIVHRAMAREPLRRYQSAAELGADIRRYLAGEPIEAKRDSHIYALRKTIRRYRWPLGAAAALAAGVTAFAGYAAVQSVRYQQQAEAARQEKAKAERIADFLEGALLSVESSVALGRDTTIIKDMMDRLARSIRGGELAAAPEAELRVRRTVADVYRRILALEDAGELLVPALALAEELYGRQSQEYAGALQQYGLWLSHSRRYDEARATLLEHVEILRELFPGDHPAVARGLHGYGDWLRGAGRFEEARAVLGEALSMRRRLHEGDHPDIAATLYVLAWCAQEAVYAYPFMVEALEMYQRLYPDDHPMVARCMCDLGYGLEYLGRPVEAQAMLESALAMQRRLFPEGSRELQTSVNALRVCYESLGRYADSLALAEELLILARRHHPARHQNVARGLHAVGWSLECAGRSKEALPLLEESLAIRRERLPDDHYVLSQSLNALAVCLVSLGEPERAIPLFEEAIEVRAVSTPRDNYAVRAYECGLASALVDLGRLDEAEALLGPAWETFLHHEISPRRFAVRVGVLAWIKLFDARHRSDPDGGHGPKAGQWRAMLELFEQSHALPPAALSAVLAAAEEEFVGISTPK